MPLRMFSENTGWEQARKDVRYTAASLKARVDHKKDAKPLGTLLVEWNKLDVERRDADDALVDAHAGVAARSSDLNVEVANFSRQLKTDLGADHQHVYAKFFVEAPSALAHMGLETEMVRTHKFEGVAAEVSVSAAAQTILDRIKGIETEGGRALALREKATAQIARVSLRIEAWKEKANTARRTVETTLAAYATEKNLPRSYADSFFPAAVHAGKSEGQTTPATPAVIAG